jgi:hypothetical protein
MGGCAWSSMWSWTKTCRCKVAHGFVTAMEAEILREAPEIDSVLTHIESEPATIEQPEEMVEVDRKIEWRCGPRANFSRDCGCA